MTAARRPPPTYEHEEQVAVVQWFDCYACLRWPWLRLPDGRPGIMAIPNGGARNVAVAVKLRAEGLSRGVPDLLIPALGLWIELKRKRGGRLSQDQAAWQEYLIETCGFAVVVCRGADEAIKLITEYATGEGAR
jgi:hypothetical protein